MLYTHSTFQFQKCKYPSIECSKLHAAHGSCCSSKIAFNFTNQLLCLFYLYTKCRNNNNKLQLQKLKIWQVQSCSCWQLEIFIKIKIAASCLTASGQTGRAGRVNAALEYHLKFQVAFAPPQSAAPPLQLLTKNWATRWHWLGNQINFARAKSSDKTPGHQASRTPRPALELSTTAVNWIQLIRL